ncbi:MAG: alpha/beta hydrolase [Phycisphaerales bacterium]|nr:alpha/beta hydrolase [Phycisphaerales bacterium]
MRSSFASALSYQKIALSNGASVSYIDQGNGTQTIVFVHGLATYAGTWLQNIEVLKNSFRCVAIDLPGNGYSDKGDLPYSMQYYAACIYDFIQLMKLKNVVLCGHSMGGQIAMTLLLNVPHAAEKIILCAPAGFEQFNVFEKTMYRSAIGMADMFSSDENNIRTSIYNSFYQNPRQADAMIKDLIDILAFYPSASYKKMMDASIQGMMNEPVYNRLGEILLPCLVIFGALDALIPNKLLHPIATEQLAIRAVAKIPNARLEMIPFAGHFVQWEKADKVNEAMVNFLK